MKKYLPIIIFLSFVKLIIHLIGNQNYGFHRDELLHLSASEHLDWGYYEFPPFIAVIAKLAHWLFGYSLSGIRIFATFAGIGVLVLCCGIAKEIGGKSKGVWLAGICILGFLPLYRNHTLFQPVAFDQFFWTLGFYFLVKYINTDKAKYLLFIGITAGIGLMTKYTFFIWGVGVVVGLLFHRKSKAFKEPSFYLAGLLVLLMSLPNFIWEYNHNFPIFQHLMRIKEIQSEEANPFNFLTDQFSHLFTFIVSIIGLIACFLSTDLKKYRPIAVAVIMIFATMWYQQSKSYYFFAAYPVLFAFGAVTIAKFLQRRTVWYFVVAAVLFVPAMCFLPKAIPVLPIKMYVDYAGLKPNIDGRIILPDDYADMFGWQEQVKLIDSVYRSLPQLDQSHCMIFAENYGEAAAIQILGKPYHLPNPVCFHGSFWLWGTGNTDRQICISIGNEKENLNRLYKEVELVKTVKHKYAIGEENNIPVYICHNPKIDLQKKWPDLEKYIFD